MTLGRKTGEISMELLLWIYNLNFKKANRQTFGFSCFHLWEHLLDTNLQQKHRNIFHSKCLPRVCPIALQNTLREFESPRVSQGIIMFIFRARAWFPRGQALCHWFLCVLFLPWTPSVSETGQMLNKYSLSDSVVTVLTGCHLHICASSHFQIVLFSYSCQTKENSPAGTLENANHLDS